MQKGFFMGAEFKFARTELLLGKEAFEVFQKSRVVIFGVGAVGGYALEALARSGVGAFKLIDFDVVKYTNFNRQLLALEGNLDKPKVEAAKARVLAINPLCEVEALRTFAEPDNLDSLLSGQVDLVVDAIDSINSKVELLAQAFHKGLPIVSAMGAGVKTDPEQIHTADLFETDVCHLSRLMRKRLRKKGVSEGIRCVYSLEPPKKAISYETHEKETSELRKSKAIGSLCSMTGIFGLRIAHEALRVLLQKHQLGF